MDPENEEKNKIVEETENPAPEIEPKVITKPEARYIPYQHPEEVGIVDTETNMIVGTDIFIILAKILNELDEIKKSAG